MASSPAAEASRYSFSPPPLSVAIDRLAALAERTHGVAHLVNAGPAPVQPVHVQHERGHVVVLGGVAHGEQQLVERRALAAEEVE
jgi:hypothetical protein